MPTRCPHCEETIEHLDFSQDCSYNGKADLDGDMGYSDGDYDNYGDVAYYCPECGENVYISELIEFEEEEEEEKPEEKEPEYIIKTLPQIEKRIHYCVKCKKEVLIINKKCSICKMEM